MRAQAAGNVRGAFAGFKEQVNQSVNLAMVSTLRTGNRLLDMLLCMVAPLFVRYFLLTDYRRFLRMIQDMLHKLTMRRPHLRVIEYTDGGNVRVAVNDSSSQDSTDRNNLLQRAIRLYIGDRNQLEADELDTSLVPLQKVKLDEEKCQFFGTKRIFNGTYEQLLSFAVRTMPRCGLWINVDQRRQIWFMQTKDVLDPTGEGKLIQNKTTFNVKAYGPNARASVTEWIDEAFEWYKELRKAERDTSRYFFVAVPGKKKDDSKDSKAPYLFKQYRLSDHKTFSSLFFPERDSLLALVDQFLHKEGKFAIDGFPNKLGLLLDGPPGTGKTSLIKALAHYTGRHVVSVNLTKVKTNQELMDLFFDRVFPVQGGEFPLKMGFEDLIFVMEDVDAASKVVYARKPARATKASKAATGSGKVVDAAEQGAPRAGAGDAGAGEMPPEAAALQRFSSANSEARRPELEAGGARRAEPEAAEGPEAEEEAESPHSRRGERHVGAVVGELLCQIASGGRGGGRGGGSDSETQPCARTSRYAFDEEDELNLAGLLNVLDGVVDSPGRILVMTTNHPERLDPALIRPGRINKRIHLGHLDAEGLCAMAEHYLQLRLSSADRAGLEALADRLMLTPAKVEQCCAESACVEDLVRRLSDAA